MTLRATIDELASKFVRGASPEELERAFGVPAGNIGGKRRATFYMLA